MGASARGRENCPQARPGAEPHDSPRQKDLSGMGADHAPHLLLLADEVLKEKRVGGLLGS
jgi:hypothetical protein